MSQQGFFEINDCVTGNDFHILRTSELIFLGVDYAQKYNGKAEAIQIVTSAAIYVFLVPLERDTKLSRWDNNKLFKLRIANKSEGFYQSAISLPGISSEQTYTELVACDSEDGKILLQLKVESSQNNNVKVFTTTIDKEGIIAGWDAGTLTVPQPDKEKPLQENGYYDIYTHPDVKDVRIAKLNNLDAFDSKLKPYEGKAELILIATKSGAYSFLVPLEPEYNEAVEEKGKMYFSYSTYVTNNYQICPELDLPALQGDEIYHRLNMIPSRNGQTRLTLVICNKDFTNQKVYYSFVDSIGSIGRWRFHEEETKQLNSTSQPPQLNMYKYEPNTRISTHKETQSTIVNFVESPSLDCFPLIKPLADKFYMVSVKAKTQLFRYVLSFVIPNDRQDHAKTADDLGFVSGQCYISFDNNQKHTVAQRNPTVSLPVLEEGEFYSNMRLKESFTGNFLLYLTVEKTDNGKTVHSRTFRLNLFGTAQWMFVPSLLEVPDAENKDLTLEDLVSTQPLNKQTYTSNTRSETVYKFDTQEEIVQAYGDIMGAVANYMLSVLSADSKEKNDLYLKELFDEYTKQTLARRVRD